MSANKKQEGGSHYAVDGVQHWDYVDHIGSRYIEAAAAKYILRWRKKGGTEDLKKALHYIEKRLEGQGETAHRIRSGTKRNDYLFNRYIADNNVPQEERLIIDSLLHWTRAAQLHMAHSAIRGLIEMEGSDE